MRTYPAVPKDQCSFRNSNKYLKQEFLTFLKTVICGTLNRMPFKFMIQKMRDSYLL